MGVQNLCVMPRAVLLAQAAKLNSAIVVKFENSLTRVVPVVDCQVLQDLEVVCPVGET
jgi:actin-related protein